MPRFDFAGLSRIHTIKTLVSEALLVLWIFIFKIKITEKRFAKSCLLYIGNIVKTASLTGRRNYEIPTCYIGYEFLGNSTDTSNFVPEIHSAASGSKNITSEPGTVFSGDVDPIKESKRWSKRIDEVGAKQVYEEFKKKYAPYRFAVQHTGAHVMGELLYKKEGIEGLAVCDEAFAFGCYHVFFGRAISERGIGIISDLDKACRGIHGSAGTGCQHGIGHGILAYMGSDQLIAALNACLKTTQPHPLHGCTAGVFMEYNTATIFSPEKIRSVTRKLNPDNPHEPCNSVPERFKTSCYFEIGLWWKQVLNGDYEKIGKLCREVIGKESRTSCYVGIGNVIASSSEYDVGETINTCQKMPDNEGEAQCRIGAATRLQGTDNYKLLAPELCKGLDKNFKDRCLLLLDQNRQ